MKHSAGTPFVPLLILLFAAISMLHRVDAAESIEILIQQLDSPKREERVAAKKSLVELGKQSLPVLEKSISLRPQASYELKEIVGQIRHQIASDSLSGTSVSFTSVEQSTLEQVSKTLSEQTEFKIRVDARVANLPINLQMHDVRFWDAIDRVARQADVGWEIQESVLVFTPDALLKIGETDYPKCIRVAAFQHSPKQNLRNLARQGLIRVNFRIDIEQGIIPYYLRISDQDFQIKLASSEEGEVISSFNQGAVREVSVRREPVFEFVVDFQSNEPIQSQRAILQGKVELFCAAQSEIESISLAGTPIPSEHLKLLSVEKTNDALLATVHVNLPKDLAAFDSHRMTMLHREAWLLQGEHQRIPFTAKRILNVQGQIHTVEFRFPYPVEAPRFVYKYPEFITSLPIEFELNQLNISAK